VRVRKRAETEESFLATFSVEKEKKKRGCSTGESRGPRSALMVDTIVGQRFGSHLCGGALNLQEVKEAARESDGAVANGARSKPGRLTPKIQQIGRSEPPTHH